MDTRRLVLSALAAAAALLAAACAPKAGQVRPIAAPSPVEGRVVFVSGPVRIERDGATTDAEPGDAIGAGAVVTTGDDGFCELQFGDSISVRIEPGTVFRADRVQVAGHTAVSGRMTAGDVVAKVRRLSGSDLRIETPSAVLGVRGTAFKVSVSGTATRVTVREGTVAVGRDDATPREVSAGERAEVDTGAEPSLAPADPAVLREIDAFVPSPAATADRERLVKVVVVVEPADAAIILDGAVVGRGTWGAVLEEGAELTLVIRAEGYDDDVVFVPPKGQRAARIARKLIPKPRTEVTPAPEPGAAPDASPALVSPAPEAPATTPAAETPASSSTTAEAPAAEPEPAAVEPGPVVVPSPEPPASEPRAARTQAVEFRVDPAIGDDPFFRWAAALFARQVPGFALVTGPGSANLASAAWPRGADLAGGMSDDAHLTYERLPQLVAAKLVRPLDGWFEWTDLAPALVDAVRVSGKVYGIPLGGSSPLLYYNRDLTAEPPRTWEEVARLAADLAPKGVAGLVMPDTVPFFMAMFPESRGVRLLVPDTTQTRLGTPEAAKAYDDLREALDVAGAPRGLTAEQAVARFAERRAATLVEGPWSFARLRRVLGDSLETATLPSWGPPPREPFPYVNVLALFVSSSVGDERAAVLRRFAAFLLEEKTQAELAVVRLKTASPLAPALRLRAAAPWAETDRVVATLYRQLETAVPMPRGPLAGDAWITFEEVLSGLRRFEGGEDLRQMAGARFLLLGLQHRQAPAGQQELRAAIDAPEKSQGLFFRPVDDESDLRVIEVGGSRGVVSARPLGTFEDGTHTMLYLVVNHAPYRDGKAPPLKARVEYFDEPNASLRVKYDSKDRSVRENQDDPESWGAWKEAAFVACEGTRTWRKIDFPIPDARFSGRLNGADLRIEVAAKGKVPAVRLVILSGAK